jgi:hypothetical protein
LGKTTNSDCRLEHDANRRSSGSRSARRMIVAMV